jgi:hypothetical protein
MECKDILYGSCMGIFIRDPSLNSSCAKNLRFKADVTLSFSSAEAVPELKLIEYIIYYRAHKALLEVKLRCWLR